MPGINEWGRCRRTLVLAQTRPFGEGAGFAVIAPKNRCKVPWSPARVCREQGSRGPLGTAGEAMFDQSLPEQV